MIRTGRVRVLAAQGAALLALVGRVDARPVLIWNATASAPIGLYSVEPVSRPKLGDLLVVRPDPVLSGWMVERRYIGRDVPLVKQLAAVAGASVCRSGVRVVVNGQATAIALAHDHLGRVLPVWSGCRTLRPDQIFLLNAAPASLDGRYFGPTRVADVVGRATPIWLRTAR